MQPAVLPTPAASGRAIQWRSLEFILGALLTGVMLALVLLSVWIFPDRGSAMDLAARLSPPFAQWAHPLGTDPLGRDVLARVLVGGRISLMVGFLSVLGASLLGITIGLVAGYYRGVWDIILMRCVDVQLALPFILIALTFISILGGGLGNIIIFMIISQWVQFARLVRGMVLSVREREFVQAARAFGVRDLAMVRHHILPNVIGPVIILMALNVANNILLESSLTFLGLGVDPLIPSWGGMLADGRTYMQTAWWVTVFPGVAIMLTVLGLNLLGDWLRDRIDPTGETLMAENLLLEATLPRTLDAWVERFEQPQWRGATVEGWLFEGAQARRAAEQRLRSAGVQATLRSAYKPLVHFFLEEVDRSLLSAVTVRYPVHPRASERRFLLEAYPLAAMLPGCALEFVAGSDDLHYEVELTWKDGRRQHLKVFAPNRSHTGPTGIEHLSPTGWLRVRSDTQQAIDAAQQTDHEQVFEHVLRTALHHPWPKTEPYFQRLDIRVELPGIEQPLPFLDECISTHEALHEDIYFSLLEIFQRRSGRAPGDRRLQPGQIVPDIRRADGAPRLRIALRGFDPAPPVLAAADGGVPLHLLGAAPGPERIAAEMERLRGERFGALSLQGRGVAGLYHEGPAAPVFISGGQHANETSGIVGALRAASALQEQGRAHFALVALENPDGYALQRELSAHNPAHMQHAARYSALGDDIEYRDQEPWHERSARQHAIAVSGAQLHLNLHGYPAHEWTRPWSGYLPQGFELWTVPKGFFLVLRHHPGWQAEARGLLEQVCAALRQVPGLADYNARQLALYQRHAGKVPFEVIHGLPCSVSEVDRPGAPVTLVTEFPDETVHGDAFRFAHTVQMETVLAAVRAWQSLARTG